MNCTIFGGMFLVESDTLINNLRKNYVLNSDTKFSSKVVARKRIFGVREEHTWPLLGFRLKDKAKVKLLFSHANDLSLFVDFAEWWQSYVTADAESILARDEQGTS